MSNTSTDRADRVWLLMGLTGSAPCILQMQGGKVSLTLVDRGALTTQQLQHVQERAGVPDVQRRLTGGAQVELFRIDSIGAHATFPWYYFGGGCHCTVGGVRYRISFLQPQNTKTWSQHDTGTIADVVQAVGSGRDVGHAWRELLRR